MGNTESPLVSEVTDSFILDTETEPSFNIDTTDLPQLLNTFHTTELNTMTSALIMNSTELNTLSSIMMTSTQLPPLLNTTLASMFNTTMSSMLFNATMSTILANNTTSGYTEYLRVGSFRGHVLPGTSLLLFGLWRTSSVLRQFYQSRRAALLYSRGHSALAPYKSMFLFPVKFMPNVPVSGLVLVGVVSSGILMEAFNSLWEDDFLMLGGPQRITVCVFFGLPGVALIVQHFGYELLPDLDYLTHVLAFVVEGMLYYYTSDVYSPFYKQMHMFLVYAIVGCAVSAAAETYYKESVMPALCRGYFLMLQGTWFYQIGFSVYNPFGNNMPDEGHRTMMLTTLMFTWHLGAVLLLVVVMAGRVQGKVFADHPKQGYQLVSNMGYATCDGLSAMDLNKAVVNNGEANCLMGNSDSEDEI